MLVAILVLWTWWEGEPAHIPSPTPDSLPIRQGAGAVRPWLFRAFALAFAIKVPIFPFHTWLPDAHVEAPTAGSVDAGRASCSRWARTASCGSPCRSFPMSRFEDPGNVMVTLAVIGIVYAALVAMVQPDLKKLVAYSSVSHLGFVMLGIWAMTVQSVQGAVM